MSSQQHRLSKVARLIETALTEMERVENSIRSPTWRRHARSIYNHLLSADKKAIDLRHTMKPSARRTSRR